jgi:ferredoxin-thioredoxin reductase catalytic subunit
MDYIPLDGKRRHLTIWYGDLKKWICPCGYVTKSDAKAWGHQYCGMPMPLGDNRDRPGYVDD